MMKFGKKFIKKFFLLLRGKKESAVVPEQPVQEELPIFHIKGTSAIGNNTEQQNVKNYKYNASPETFETKLNVNADDYSQFKIEQLMLSARPLNWLKQNDCLYISDVLRASPESLLKMHNIGITSVIEIEGKIQDFILKHNLEDISAIKPPAKAENISEKNELHPNVQVAHYEIFSQIPEKVKDAALMPFLKAFEASSNAKLINKLNSLPLENCSIRDFYALAEKEQRASKITQNKIWNFFLWLNFDTDKIMKETADNILQILKSKEKDFEILKLRAEGKTLQETGEIIGITRERARQIENRSVYLFWNIFSAQKYDMFMLYYALSEGNIFFDLKDLNIENKEYEALLSYCLPKMPVSKWYRYIDKLNMFAIITETGLKTEKLCELINSAVNNMPDTLKQEDFYRQLKNIVFEHGLSENIVLKYAKQIYRLEGKFYCKKLLTVPFMCNYVLLNYFQSGYKIADSECYAKFKQCLTDNFGKKATKITDRAIDANITKIGCLCERGKYIHYSLIDVKPEIISQIKQAIEKSAEQHLMFNNLYSLLGGLLNSYGINNRYMLQGIIKKYLPEYDTTKDYLILKKKQGKTASIPAISNATAEYPDFLISAAKSIIRQEFSNGMRINSIIAQNKFRNTYQEIYGETLDRSVDIDSLALQSGIEDGGKIYIISDEAKQAVKELIEKAFHNGNRVILFSELYSQNNSFMSSHSINGENLLKSVIRRIFPKMQYEEDCFYPMEDDILEHDIKRCFENNIAMSCSQIKQLLPYTGLEKIKSELKSSDLFVFVNEDLCVLASSIEISSEDLENSRQLIEKDISEQGFSSMQNIHSKKTEEMNPGIPAEALKETIFIRHLKRNYARKGYIISPVYAKTSLSDKIKEFCASREKTTLMEMQEFEKSINGSTSNSLRIACEFMIRVNAEEFVSKKLINFDIEKTDREISRFSDGQVISIKKITSFSSFPYIENYPWNEFMLESYCRNISHKFSYMGRLPSATGVCGAIIPKDMAYMFNEYDDVLAYLAANSGIELEEKGITAYLIERGYILRSRKIDNVLSKATKKRKVKDSFL